MKITLCYFILYIVAICEVQSSKNIILNNFMNDYLTMMNNKGNRSKKSLITNDTFLNPNSESSSKNNSNTIKENGEILNKNELNDDLNFNNVGTNNNLSPSLFSKFKSLHSKVIDEENRISKFIQNELDKLIEYEQHIFKVPIVDSGKYFTIRQFDKQTPDNQNISKNNLNDTYLISKLQNINDVSLKNTLHNKDSKFFIYGTSKKGSNGNFYSFDDEDLDENNYSQDNSVIEEQNNKNVDSNLNIDVYKNNLRFNKGKLKSKDEMKFQAYQISYSLVTAIVVISIGFIVSIVIIFISLVMSSKFYDQLKQASFEISDSLTDFIHPKKDCF